MFRSSGLLILFLSTIANADVLIRDTLGVSQVQWNERLRVSVGELTDKGKAAYSGAAISWDKSWTWDRAGVGAGFLYSVGRAAAGDFAGSVDFQDTGDRKYTLLAVTPRMVFLLNRQIRMGPIIPIFYRQAAWASKNESLYVEPRRQFFVGFGGEIRVLLNSDWEIVQNIGALSLEGETYWRFGLQYRL